MKKISPSLLDYQSAGQGYLLKYIQTLNEEEQNKIIQKLQKYDIKQLSQTYQQYKSKIVQMKPYEKIRCLEFDEKDQEIGYTTIAEGKLAIVLSAQQNISLLDIQLPSHKCLLQLYCERIWSLQNLIKQHCGKCLPILIFIMTTNINHDMITSFFSEKKHFGLQEDQIFVIQQDQLPLFNLEGQILFSNQFQIFDECIGNGYIYLNQSVLDTMKLMGITILHLCSIENVLCKFGDPIWIGAFIKNQLYLSAKCVQKRSFDENLGIIINQFDQGLQYKEYDEITYNDLFKRDQNGCLSNSDGVIGQILCSLDYALELCCNYKKYILSKSIKSISQPNALKFELTYYVAIPYCPIQLFGLFRVKREDEYAPILNPSNQSKDTIHTARQAYMQRDQKWMSQLGFEINQEFEISPKLTYFGEGLEEAIKMQIKNKQQIPLILHSDKQIRTVRMNSVHNYTMINQFYIDNVNFQKKSNIIQRSKENNLKFIQQIINLNIKYIKFLITKNEHSLKFKSYQITNFHFNNHSNQQSKFSIVKQIKYRSITKSIN
ncbi:unnamed protein product [Paramecium pentaurelia]|uniref:UTP--glucose-1-phosphate uridylyltransferase n=1 Tax=Paramecium pentaurelia TaxID=43138 RepID=A0A8S1U2Y2_9CILI|nr:unnamed protein product [Paramecium pentaurelia]